MHPIFKSSHYQSDYSISGLNYVTCRYHLNTRHTEGLVFENLIKTRQKSQISHKLEPCVRVSIVVNRAIRTSFSRRVVMESCAPGLTSWNFLFSFLPLQKNYTLLLALPCQPVCKPEAVGKGIAIRAKVEQTGGHRGADQIFLCSTQLFSNDCCYHYP